jgi:hypothetical protein
LNLFVSVSYDMRQSGLTFHANSFRNAVHACRDLYSLKLVHMVSLSAGVLIDGEHVLFRNTIDVTVLL